MLRRTPSWSTVVCLARIVMPFSRSRSPESMTRSTTAWFGAERAGLAEHRVDERGLAVVDVGDDGDVAQVGAGRGRSGGGVGHESDGSPGRWGQPIVPWNRRIPALAAGRYTRRHDRCRRDPVRDRRGRPRRHRWASRASAGWPTSPGPAAHCRWSSSSPDPDGAVAAALAGTEAVYGSPAPRRGRPGRPDGPRRRARRRPRSATRPRSCSGRRG